MVTKRPAAKKKAAKKKVTKKRVAKKRAVHKRPPTGKTVKDNGGSRAGSGRKVGAATKKTRAIADKLVDDGGQTPLEYMLETLRTGPEELKKQFYDEVIDEDEYRVKLAALIDRRDRAAETAAPYIHPRLSSIEANIGLKDQDFFVDLFNKESEG